jgi:hypothetical protein
MPIIIESDRSVADDLERALNVDPRARRRC